MLHLDAGTGYQAGPSGSTRRETAGTGDQAGHSGGCRRAASLAARKTSGAGSPWSVCGMSVQPAPVTGSQVPSTAGKSASNAACRYCCLKLVPVVGLLNWNGVGWILVLPLGHSRWYEAPSNPVLVNVQPCTLNSSASLAGKQKRPSPSAFTALSPRPPNSPFRQAVG